jgi:hypothetical protein
MFIIRRIALTVLVLIALVLGASVVLESFAESQLSTGLMRTLSLKKRPDVQINAFPILLRVLQRKIPEVIVSANDLEIEKLTIDELMIDMRGVSANLDVLFRSDRFDLTVDHGEGSAKITEEALNAFLKRNGHDVRVTSLPDGSVFVRADGVGGGRKRRFEARGKLTLDGRKLSFKPSRVTMDGATPPPGLAPTAKRETTFTVEIPKLPGDIVPGEVIVTAGEVTLVANLEHYKLRLK